MLYISFKKDRDTLIHVDGYFDWNFEEEWFNDSMVKEMVKAVDKTEVVGPNLMISPVLGPIPPQMLSGGVKALILMLKEPEHKIWATVCGDNCAHWVIEIAKKHDVHIVLTHIMEFEEDFDAIVEDTGEELHSLSDYRRCMIFAFHKN